MSITPEFDKARQTAVAFIGIDHSKSSGRVRNKLLTKGVDSSIVDEVIEYLCDIDYINDRRAAKRIVSRYKGRRIRSKRAMVAVFINNGIPFKVAESVASSLEDDRDTAISLCRSTYSIISEESRLDIMKLLHRRGYPADLSREVIRQLLSQTEDSYDN